jgi:hypothetical protein
LVGFVHTLRKSTKKRRVSTAIPGGAENGHLNNWLHYQRRSLRPERTCTERRFRIEKLNSIGYDWGHLPPAHCLLSGAAVAELVAELDGKDESNDRGQVMGPDANVVEEEQVAAPLAKKHHHHDAQECNKNDASIARQ